MQLHHLNDGKCAKCTLVFDRYPGFHPGLRAWFEALQSANKDAHISAAGRGKIEQEHYFAIGTSFAHYGESAHNFNLAVDIFKLAQTGAEWPSVWYRNVVKPAVDAHNASPAASFKLTWPLQRAGKTMELPHVEVSDFKALVQAGTAKLVEPK